MEAVCFETSACIVRKMCDIESVDIDSIRYCTVFLKASIGRANRKCFPLTFSEPVQSFFQRLHILAQSLIKVSVFVRSD